MKKLSIEQLLGLDKFAVDDEEAHIVLNKEICASARTSPAPLPARRVCTR